MYIVMNRMRPGFLSVSITLCSVHQMPVQHQGFTFGKYIETVGTLGLYCFMNTWSVSCDVVCVIRGINYSSVFY